MILNVVFGSSPAHFNTLKQTFIEQALAAVNRVISTITSLHHFATREKAHAEAELAQIRREELAKTLVKKIGRKQPKVDTRDGTKKVNIWGVNIPSGEKIKM